MLACHAQNSTPPNLRTFRQPLTIGQIREFLAGTADVYWTAEADERLLAEIDTLHSTLSGLATKKLMERAYYVFGDTRYQCLAAISVAHLYNLRKRAGYPLYP